jgi:hypothetical protein
MAEVLAETPASGFTEDGVTQGEDDRMTCDS